MSETAAKRSKQKPCNKNCGQNIYLEEQTDGKWRAMNIDGSFHKCDGQQQTSQKPAPLEAFSLPEAQSYDSLKRLVETTDVEEVNVLRTQAWQLLKILQRQGIQNYRGMSYQLSEIVYVLGKKPE